MNIINDLLKQTHLQKPALIEAKSGNQLSFEEVEHSINMLSSQMSQVIKNGDKVLLFVRPSLQFAPLVFALFQIGAIPILIDPGMGLKALLKSISQVSPDYMIAEPIVHLVKLLKPTPFKSIKKSFYPTSFGNVRQLKNNNEIPAAKIISKEPDELACILFTSGGTGIPKGVEYTHKIFATQTRVLQNTFKLTADDIDYPGFPLFALFTITMGMTSVIPEMNPSKPAQANPKKLYQGIEKYHPTFVAGSPAIWEKLATYCLDQHVTLPSVKYLVMFGAPVSQSLHKKFQPILSNGTTYTPYGATESLPIANASGIEILAAYQNNDHLLGTFLGKAVSNVDLKIIKEGVTPISFCKNFEIGEIIVSGDVVTKQYYNMPEETKKAKIYLDGILWHRIGDVGFLDDSNNLWFCGRTSHIVHSVDHKHYSIPTEAIFNQHPLIKKSALIVHNNRPAICVIPNSSKLTIQELSTIAKANNNTKMIDTFFLCKSFPVDVRHNIKIDRIKLGSDISRYSI